MVTHFMEKNKTVSGTWEYTDEKQNCNFYGGLSEKTLICMTFEKRPETGGGGFNMCSILLFLRKNVSFLSTSRSPS